MPLLPAKCPDCGGLIEVDNEKRLGVCQHCGNPFVVEEAIQTFNTVYNITNNYNTTNVSNNNTNIGDGAVVNIYEDKSKDFVIEAGVLIAYTGASVDVVIPEGVIEIEEGCFENLKIQSVTIPGTVEKIGDNAFNDCSRLNSVYITDLVHWCNISFGEDSANPLCNSCDLYIGGELATDIVIPDEVKTIRESLFESCSSIKSVSFGANVKKISDYAFASCENLASVTIPEVGIYVSKTAFLGTLYEQNIKNKAKEEAKRKKEIEVEENKKSVQEILNSIEIFKSNVAEALKIEINNVSAENNSPEYIDEKYKILQDIADVQIQEYEKKINYYLNRKYNLHIGETLHNTQIYEAETTYEILRILWENGGKLSYVDFKEKIKSEERFSGVSSEYIDKRIKKLIEGTWVKRSEVARCAYFELVDEDLSCAKLVVEEEYKKEKEKEKEKEYTINEYFSCPCPQMPIASDVIKLPKEPQKTEGESCSAGQQSQYRSQGLCQYCGGSFKGLFSKKCTKCGKPKDY